MKARASGFTLIELMLVVTIIGILASIAVPSFVHLQFRSKQAERVVIRKAIQAALDDYWLRLDRYPHGGPGFNYLQGRFNPAFPPGSQKRVWNTGPAYGDWGVLSLEIEGSLYFSYYVFAYSTGAQRGRWVYTYGDLDADGRYSYLLHQEQDIVVNGAVSTITWDYDSAEFDTTF